MEEPEAETEENLERTSEITFQRKSCHVACWILALLSFKLRQDGRMSRWAAPSFRRPQQLINVNLLNQCASKGIQAGKGEQAAAGAVPKIKVSHDLLTPRASRAEAERLKAATWGFSLAGKAWKPHAAIINSIILAQTAPKTLLPAPGPGPEWSKQRHKWLGLISSDARAWPGEELSWARKKSEIE